MPRLIFKPVKLMSHAEWLKRTNVTLQRRSTLLKAIDEALLTYERTEHQKAFLAVGTRLKAWQDSKGPGAAWKKNSRNKSQAIELLDSQVRGLGDSDVGLGAQSFMQPELVHARLGMLYLFSNLKIESNIFTIVLESGFDVAGEALSLGSGSGVEKAGDVLGKIAKPVVKASGMAESYANRKLEPEGKKAVASSLLLGQAPAPPQDPQTRAWYVKIVEVLKNWARQLWESICKKFDDITSDPLLFAAETLNTLVMKLAAKFLAEAIPFIKAGVDIARGLVNTTTAALAKFNEWIAGRNVELLSGSPATIVEAIKRAMWFSVGEGLYGTLKGGANLGLQFATAGASAIASVIVAITETVVKTIWKIIEITRMNNFFRQAREHWQMKDERTGLHTQPIAFNQWFRNYALSIPALSVLALNSGICGDKMHFLAMFKGDNSIVSQSAFDAGCSYVDGLKVWGASYLGGCGFKFSSADPMTSGLLKFATEHTRAQTRGERGLQLAGALLGA